MTVDDKWNDFLCLAFGYSLYISIQYVCTICAVYEGLGISYGQHKFNSMCDYLFFIQTRITLHQRSSNRDVLVCVHVIFFVRFVSFQRKYLVSLKPLCVTVNAHDCSCIWYTLYELNIIIIMKGARAPATVLSLIWKIISRLRMNRRKKNNITHTHTLSQQNRRYSLYKFYIRVFPNWGQTIFKYVLYLPRTKLFMHRIRTNGERRYGHEMNKSKERKKEKKLRGRVCVHFSVQFCLFSCGLLLDFAFVSDRLTESNIYSIMKLTLKIMTLFDAHEWPKTINSVLLNH